MSGGGIRRLGYVRVSMAREEMISPAVQKAAIAEDAKRTGRKITGWVEDLDATGRHFRRRVMEAVAAVEAGQADEIGVYRYDRWGRNALECLANVQRVEDAGGAVVSAMEHVDAETAMGRFTRRMAFDLAELQSDQIADNWRGAHANRVSRGLPATGTPRFGYVRLGRVRETGARGRYRRDPDDPLGERYVPDPATAGILAEMYQRDTAGEPRRAIARWLNSQGITTAAGGPWTIPGVYNVLASGFGAGLLRVHDPECRVKPSREKQCSRTVYVPGAHEPVLGPEAWAAWLERQEQRRAAPPRLRDPVHPFSGLLWCGDRGHRLRAATGRGGAIFYHCAQRGEGRGCPGAYVRETVVEEVVLAWLSQWAAGIEAAAAAEAARQRAVTRARTRGDQLARREAVLQRRLARLMARWAADENSEPAAYEMARKPIQDDLDAVRAAMKEAEGARRANAGEFLPVAAGLLAEWHTFPASERRELLSHLIARIEVHRDAPRKPARVVIVPVWEAGEKSQQPQEPHYFT